MWASHNDPTRMMQYNPAAAAAMSAAVAAHQYPPQGHYQQIPHQHQHHHQQQHPQSLFRPTTHVGQAGPIVAIGNQHHHQQQQQQSPHLPSSPPAKMENVDTAELMSTLPTIPEAKNTLVSVDRAGKGTPVSGATVFNTPVDSLVRALQSEVADTKSPSVPSSSTTPQLPVEPVSTPLLPGSAAAGPAKKTHVCPECHKAFSQKAQLTTHMRAHTEEKPYVCGWPGCGQRFSQQGNMRTHERRHTGERPFVCQKCGKSFAQSGNLRAHEGIHNRQTYFICYFRNCNKRLTQLGNLKSHHNRFHAEELAQIIDLIKNSKERGDQLPDYERKLCAYIANLYKNSNRGIKGRGKNRRISTISMRGKNAARSAGSSSAALPSPTGSFDQAHPQQQSQQQQHHQQSMLAGPAGVVSDVGRPVHYQLMNPNVQAHLSLSSPLDNCSSSTQSPVVGVLTPPPDQPGWHGFRPDLNRAFSHASAGTSDGHHAHMAAAAAAAAAGVHTSALSTATVDQYRHHHHQQQSHSQQQQQYQPSSSQAHYSSPHLATGSVATPLSVHPLPSPNGQFHAGGGDMTLPPPSSTYHQRHHYPMQQSGQQQHVQPTSHPVSIEHSYQSNNGSVDQTGQNSTYQPYGSDQVSAQQQHGYSTATTSAYSHQAAHHAHSLGGPLGMQQAQQAYGGNAAAAAAAMSGVIF